MLTRQSMRKCASHIHNEAYSPSFVHKAIKPGSTTISRLSWLLPQPIHAHYRATTARRVMQELRMEAVSSSDEEDKAFNPFPYPLPMDSTQKTFSSMPFFVFYPGLLAMIVGAGYLGGLLGRGAPVSPKEKPIASAVAAAVTGAAATYAAMQAKKKRDSAVVVELYNSLVTMEDPTQLTQEDVKRVGDKFGVNMQRDEVDGLKKIYGQFLESIIPLGDTQLKGDEAPKVKAFKEALGLTDEEAAPVHMEVARRLSRQGFEYKDRQSQFDQRKAFQRLIYVSQVVFGDQKAAFLLPWRRVFQLTDAQLFVARRDNAKAIFSNYMQSKGGDLPADRLFLRELREYQSGIKMMDESAAEVVKDYSRKYVESHVQAALDVLKAPGKTKDMGTLVAELDHVIEYNRGLVQFANEDDLIPGLGQVTLHGGVFDVESKMREIRDLYRAYIDERVERDGSFTPELEINMKELQTILNLGNKEAHTIREEVAAKLYRKLLRTEVSSKRIDQAASPAQVLGELCEKAKFGPESAAELHRQLYKQKLQSLLTKKKLTDDDVAELKRIRRILCISTDVGNKVMKETAGRILDEVISDIYLMGAKPVGEYEAERVAAVIKDLQMSRDVALEVFADVTKQKFRSYIQQAQKENDRKGMSSTIKKMVQFNALVVTPILEKVKGTDDAKKELAELMAQAVEAAKKEGALDEAMKPAEGAEGSKPAQEDPVSQVQKMIQANRGEFGDEDRKGQKEVNLKGDIEPGVAAELYKNYLLYSMSGDVVELPVGGVIRKKTNMQTRQAEMARLQQLGDLLGMSPVEVAGVHSDLSEQAFKAQATELMRGSGGLTQDKKEYLEQMRQQMNLSQEASDRILKSVRTEVLGVAAATDDGGRWDLPKVLTMSKEGVDVEKVLEEPVRRNLYRKEVEKRVSDGSGNFDPAFMTEELPKVLALEDKRVNMILKELVASRKRMLLVQSVSQFRQKRLNDASTSLANLLACYQALPEDKAVSWNEHEELKELFALFCGKSKEESQRLQLAKVLGLTDEEAKEVMADSQSTIDKLKKQKEEEESFF